MDRNRRSDRRRSQGYGTEFVDLPGPDIDPPDLPSPDPPDIPTPDPPDIPSPDPPSLPDPDPPDVPDVPSPGFPDLPFGGDDGDGDDGGGGDGRGGSGDPPSGGPVGPAPGPGPGSGGAPESGPTDWVDILSCTVRKRTLDAGEGTTATVRLRNVTDQTRYRMSTVRVDLELVADGQVIGRLNGASLGATDVADFTFDVQAPPPGRYETEVRLDGVYAAAGR